MDELEKYYPGDEAWNNYVLTFKKRWKECTFKQELLKQLKNADDIAIVMYGIGADTTMDWIATPIPALHNLTPIQCLESEQLIRRLKSMLIRMYM